MLETKKQTIAAVREISVKTDWSQREIAEKAGINHSVISRLLSTKGNVRTPTQQTRGKLSMLLAYVRDMP